MQLAYVLCNRFNASLRKFIDKAIKLNKNSWAPEQKQKYYIFSDTDKTGEMH